MKTPAKGTKDRKPNHSFNAGFRAFYSGSPEICDISGFTEFGGKEYTRGWWAAYHKQQQKTVGKSHG